MPWVVSVHSTINTVRNFIRKYLGADGKFSVITVNPGDWLIDLEHPKRNTVRCCQLCCVQEDIKRVSSPG
jgi:hypothetical protein